MPPLIADVGSEMKWMMISLVAATGNVVLMLMFAASKLGPTPLFLPLFLTALTLGAAIGSVVSAILGKRRHNQFKVLHLVAAAPWAVATAINLWAVQGILYVT